MIFNTNIFDRVLRTKVVRSGIQRAIVDKAAKMLDPVGQTFEPEAALEPLLTRFRRLEVWTVDENGIHATKDGLQVISEIWSELILANLAVAAKTKKNSKAA
ncbi:MAG: hypothetical protein GY854_29215 [Deltaproteobacteria bacterium]|nr:hypothetical protein [Deltaproteobacteria bacterium]